MPVARELARVDVVLKLAEVLLDVQHVVVTAQELVNKENKNVKNN
jgi:hypothetical protein